MKFVVATLSFLVLVFLVSGSLIFVGGVLNPEVFSAALN